jgi:hypothetical protein
MHEGLSPRASVALAAVAVWAAFQSWAAKLQVAAAGGSSLLLPRLVAPPREVAARTSARNTAAARGPPIAEQQPAQAA